MKPDEVRSLPEDYLRLIILIEARAAPRLREVDGLWRKPVLGRRGAEARPGSMTAFIRQEGLLSDDAIAEIIANAPPDLISFREGAARVSLDARPPIRQWIDRFLDGIDQKAA